MGYYIEQVESAYKADWEKAMQTIDTSVTPMYDTMKSIIEENDFPSKAEERWVALLGKIQSLSSDIKTETSNKYDEMINKALQFQGWFDELKALEGNAGGEAGLQFAIDHGFGRWVGTYSPRSQGGITKEDTIYRWTAYKSVSIDSDGYIQIDMCRHEMKKRKETEMGIVTNSIVYDKEIAANATQVKTAEEFAKFGKTGISGDCLTSDSNGDGNSSFR